MNVELDLFMEKNNKHETKVSVRQLYFIVRAANRWMSQLVARKKL